MSRLRRLLGRLDRVLALAERVLGELAPGAPSRADFARHVAFRWEKGRGPGRLVAIPEPAHFDLDDLIGVDDSVAAFEQNVRQLLAGLPYNDVLLYGERGTGKSSAVRGALTRYAGHGLRVVEVDRNDLVDLPAVLAALAAGGDHAFLIYCDDLSFSSGEAGHRELKAALQGSLVQRPRNTCIVATSNRRHLLPETVADNRGVRVDEEGELHHGEALEEKLALSDRFGLVLGFYNFDQPTYLEIVGHYLARAGVPDMDEPLRREALRFALERASRSGRTARQFVDGAVGRIRLAEKKREPKNESKDEPGSS